MATDIARLRRENLIMELGQYSTVIDWEHGMPLEPSLKGVEKWVRRGTGR